MTQKDQIEAGQLALSLLQNPVFSEVINSLCEEKSLELVNSKPAEKEKREECYHTIRALKAVVAVLHTRVEVAQALEAALLSEEEEEPETLTDKDYITLYGPGTDRNT